MKANDFIMAPKRLKLSEPTTTVMGRYTEGEEAKKGYAEYLEKKLEFSVLFEGVKQQRVAKQRQNRSEIYDHEVDKDEVASNVSLANVLKTVSGPGSKRKKKF